MSIDIDIDENNNNAPVFTDGTSTTHSIAENTASGVNIGSAVAATNADTGDTLTYTLGGTDAAMRTAHPHSPTAPARRGLLLKIPPLVSTSAVLLVRRMRIMIP